MNNNQSVKQRHCPSCGWKFPISKARAPIERVDGTTFNCPDCRTTLVYRTKSASIYQFFTLLTLPAIFFLHEYGDDPTVEKIAVLVILPLAIIATVIWRLNEYIEPISSDDN